MCNHSHSQCFRTVPRAEPWVIVIDRVVLVDMDDLPDLLSFAVQTVMSMNEFFLQNPSLRFVPSGRAPKQSSR